MLRKLIKHGWRAVTEAHTAYWIVELLGAVVPPSVLTSMVAGLGEHSVAILCTIFFFGLATSTVVVLVILGYRADRKTISPSASPTASLLDDVAESIPDVRVADNPSVIDLFQGNERDKLFPLLEAEKLAAWARPDKGPAPGVEASLTKLVGSTWKSHYFVFYPRVPGQFERNQTFVKGKGPLETSYYDVHLNQKQVERAWLELQQIPILEAARVAFDRAEELEIGDLIWSKHHTSSQKLSNFINAFLVRDFQLRGIKPPSHTSRLIPASELGRLHHVLGTNSISSDFASEPLRYDEVTIIRRDLDAYLDSIQRAATDPA
jgi:hypothetical protein